MPYLGNSPASNLASVTKDTFSGDGSTTAFTLSKAATTNGVAVFVENVRQEPTTAYAVSGTTLTFTAAPVSASGNNIYVLHHNTPASTANHPAAQALTATSGTFTDDVAVDTDTLFVDASADKVGIGTTSPQQDLHLKANNPGGKIRLEMGQTGVADTDVTGEIQFYHNDASGAGVNADIKGICTNSAGAGALTFGTGTTSTTERVRIASDGKLTVTMSSDNTNAEADLGVVHILKNTSSVVGSGSMLCFGSNSNFGTGIYGQLVNSSTNEHKLGFQVRNSSGSSGTRLLLTGDGNLGLGTISPLGFTTGQGLHLGDGRSVGFGDGANSRPDFQISCINGTALDFRCGNGADTADLTINTSGVFSGDFNDT